MPQLRIRVDKFLDGMYTSPEVIANVFNTEEKKKSKRGLILPLNKEESISLMPGHYLIEVVLPSGEVLNTEVDVKHHGIDNLIVLKSEEDSPYEFLSWQQLYGIADLEEKGRRPYEIRSSILSVIAPVDIESFLKHFDYTSRWPPQPEISRFANIKVMRENSFPRHSTRLKDIHVFRKPYSDTRSDRRYSIGFPSRDDYRSTEFNRIFLQLESKSSIPNQICTVPIPWHIPDSEDLGIVDVLVNRARKISNLDHGFRLSTVVRDSHFGSILAYLGSGETFLAKKILERVDVMDMLYKKVVNPFAAAAGGYILLNTSQTEKYMYDNREIDESEWNKWIVNLKDWFKWLPDGAILYAWTQLRSEGSDTKWENAQRGFLEACARGLPVYSLGVRMLRDGLTLLSNRKEGVSRSAVEKALSLVLELSSRIDINQPFTTILVDPPFYF